MSAEDIIAKLRNNSGHWNGDETATRVLNEVLAKFSRPIKPPTYAAVDKAQLIEWVNYLHEFRDNVGTGCETHRRINVIVAEMEKFL